MLGRNYPSKTIIQVLNKFTDDHEQTDSHLDYRDKLLSSGVGLSFMRLEAFLEVASGEEEFSLSVSAIILSSMIRKLLPLSSQEQRCARLIFFSSIFFWRLSIFLWSVNFSDQCFPLIQFRTYQSSFIFSWDLVQISLYFSFSCFNFQKLYYYLFSLIVLGRSRSDFLLRTFMLLPPPSFYSRSLGLFELICLPENRLFTYLSLEQNSGLTFYSFRKGETSSCLLWPWTSFYWFFWRLWATLPMAYFYTLSSSYLILSLILMGEMSFLRGLDLLLCFSPSRRCFLVNMRSNVRIKL